MFKYLRLLSIFFVIFHSSCLNPRAYSHSNFNGNITIKWDLINWTPDGYVAVVTIYNYQKHRGIVAPGWNLTWTWAGKEIIWSIVGAQTTNQGDCSKFVEYIPHNCEKSPTLVDLMPTTPYNQQIENCCKGGVLAPWSGQAQARAHARSMSAFQLSVGSAGTTNRTVKRPKNFAFRAPRSKYYCGSAKIVKATRFISDDGRRTTRAQMTWKVTCWYSN